MKTILFVTGTRADFGKLKPLMQAVDKTDGLRAVVFVTGMHTLKLYGRTQNEVERAGFRDIHVFHNQCPNEAMDQILANTISGLSRFVHENRPDLIVVHGDRVETLAGAIVGALNNLLVAHVEGGERSGTIDELIRHAVSKMSHAHFVSNREAADRLLQLGEVPESIFEIGSPDVDVMKSASLPSLRETLDYYRIPFDRYGILLFHPVTTELESLDGHAEQVVSALERSALKWIVVYPNNDAGSHSILRAYQARLTDQTRFRLFPSIRFEFFLVLLENATVLLGNSSAGVREAPMYGVPSVNVGTRQHLRYVGKEVINVGYSADEILTALTTCGEIRRSRECDWSHFGTGGSADLFLAAIKTDDFWNIPRQKVFRDLV